MIITIDGPAGSGKSTVAEELAHKLQAAFLDTGAMYRAVTLAALRQNLSLDNQDALTKMVAQGPCQIDFARRDKQNIVQINGQDVTSAIRDRQVTDQSHKIAALPRIRDLLVQRQRQIAQKATTDTSYNCTLVTEGRDQGTVVFPDAQFKFFLDASAQCRAQRRWLQLPPPNRPHLEQVLKDQQQRDRRDASRKVAPLKPATDAMVIDTTEMTLEQVVNKLYQIVTSRKEA